MEDQIIEPIVVMGELGVMTQLLELFRNTADRYYEDHIAESRMSIDLRCGITRRLDGRYEIRGKWRFENSEEIQACE